MGKISELSVENAVELIQFTLNPEIAYPKLRNGKAGEVGIRQRLYSFLILDQLRTKNALLFDEIKRNIESELGNIRIDRQLIQEALDVLIGEEPAKVRPELDPDKGKTVYRLNESTKRDLDVFSKAYKDLFDKASNEFFDLAKRHFSKDFEPYRADAAHQFELVLEKLLEEYSFELYSLMAKADEKTLEKVRAFYSQLPSEIEDEAAEAIRLATEELVENFAQYPYFSELILNLQLGLVVVHILGLDPELITFLQEDIKNKRFYLDTNVLVSGIVHADPKNRVTYKLFTTAKDFSIKLFYTDRTMREIDFFLEGTKELVRDLSRVSARVREETLRDVGLSSAISFFREEWIDWYDYEESFREAMNNLFKQFKVVEDKTIPDLEVRDEIKGELVRNIGKKEKEAEHDAFNIAVMRWHRSQDEEWLQKKAFWANYWFLTWDAHLQKYERYCADKTVEKAIYDPTCITGLHMSLLLDPYLIMKGEKFQALSTPKFIKEYGMALSQAMTKYNPTIGRMTKGLAKETAQLLQDKEEKEMIMTLRKCHRERLNEFIINYPLESFSK